MSSDALGLLRVSLAWRVVRTTVYDERAGRRATKAKICRGVGPFRGNDRSFVGDAVGQAFDFGDPKSDPRVAGVATPPPEELALDARPRDLQNRKPHPDAVLSSGRSGRDRRADQPRLPGRGGTAQTDGLPCPAQEPRRVDRANAQWRERRHAHRLAGRAGR